ncbi:hypothetical protein ACJRO7_003830 [Eucalyptus globulus]|uniref:Uncharacterized protein n=1 Tax=Eucalyptus globulus TaxID=34317 RepID=A0ABD3IXA7_EUCGL
MGFCIFFALAKAIGVWKKEGFVGGHEETGNIRPASFMGATIDGPGSTWRRLHPTVSRSFESKIFSEPEKTMSTYQWRADLRVSAINLGRGRSFLGQGRIR